MTTVAGGQAGLHPGNVTLEHPVNLMGMLWDCMRQLEVETCKIREMLHSTLWSITHKSPRRKHRKYLTENPPGSGIKVCED